MSLGLWCCLHFTLKTSILCVICLLIQPTIQLSHQICPCHSSWLMAQQRLVFHHKSLSLHQPLFTLSAVTSHSSLSLCLSLCSGMDMDERTRQMKLKMKKYKQGAGSDSRLEQDYHKVKTCADMLLVCTLELHVHGKTCLLFA